MRPALPFPRPRGPQVGAFGPDRRNLRPRLPPPQLDEHKHQQRHKDEPDPEPPLDKSPVHSSMSQSPPVKAARVSGVTLVLRWSVWVPKPGKRRFILANRRLRFTFVRPETVRFCF